MASQVYYRFRSQRDFVPVNFEGTGISVWELKKEIIGVNNMGRASDFDFSLLDPETDQEYRNDNEIVPRATSVIARRLPAKKPGHGTAQNYIVTEGAASAAAAAASTSSTGANRVFRGEMSKRFDQPTEQPLPPKEQLNLVNTSMGELEQIQAFQQMSKEQWEVDQEKMAHGKRVTMSRGGYAGAGASNRAVRQPAPNKPVPNGYICHRCNLPGHWIQDCPTNDDPNFEEKPRIKKTTGIPRSFLTTVESRDAADNVMVTQDGTFVVARPDMASWEQHRAIAPNLSADDVQQLQPTDPDLTCPICSKLLRNAVTTKCCSTAFCEECIRDYMSKHANACPECESRIKNVSQLVPDVDRRARVAQYVDEMVRVSEEAGKKVKENDISEAGDINSPAPSADPARSESREASSAPSAAKNGFVPTGPFANGGNPANGGSTAANGSAAQTSTSDPPTPYQQELLKQQQLFQLMVLLSNSKTPATARTQCQTMLSNFNKHGSFAAPSVNGRGRGIAPFATSQGIVYGQPGLGQREGVTYGSGSAGGGFTRFVDNNADSAFMFSAPARQKRQRESDYGDYYGSRPAYLDI